MGIPPAVNLEPAQPASNTRALVRADVAPRAARDYVYTGGQVTGHVLAYGVISDFVWWFGPNAFGRIRSSTSVDTGSLLDVTEAIAQDVGFDVAHSLTVTYDPEARLAFRELARYQHSGTADLLIWPRPTQNAEVIHTAAGVTMLSLMASAWPPPVLRDFGEPGVSPQTAITEVLTAWRDSGLFPWFDFEPVPDLRTLVPELLSPAEYGPDDGLVPVRGILLPQIPDERVTMLDVIQDLLSPFPGATYRETADGTFQIVPAYGPDADETPAVVLRPEHVINVTEGRADPFLIKNRARVTSTGIGHVPDEPVMQPSWFQFGPDALLGETFTEWGTHPEPWFEVPDGYLNLQPGEDLPRQAYPGSAFRGFADTWPLVPGVLPSNDDGIELIDSNGTLMIGVTGRQYRRNELQHQGTDWLQLETSPGSGQWRYPGESGFPSRFTIPWTGELRRWRVRRPGEPNMWMEGIAYWTGSGVQFGMDPSASRLRYVGFNAFVYWTLAEFFLGDATGAVTETGTQISGEFGVLEAGDFVPGEDGSNAIEDSREKYGVREQTLHIRGYDIQDALVLKDIARGIVLRGLTPRVIRTANLTVLGSTQARNEHVGRLTQLPNAEQGAMVGRQYADNFTPPGAFAAAVQVEVLDPTGAGAIRPDDLLYFTHPDGLGWFTHPDGTPFTHPEGG